MPRYPRRRDANERAIIDALKSYGVSVQQLDGAGVPDLLAGVGGRANYLIEVKDPEMGERNSRLKGKRVTNSLGLRDTQAKWWAAWRGAPPIVVTTPAEAIDVLGALGLPYRVG